MRETLGLGEAWVVGQAERGAAPDTGRIPVFRASLPLQRPRQVSWVVPMCGAVGPTATAHHRWAKYVVIVATCQTCGAYP
jgi:hypothetical protein